MFTKYGKSAVCVKYGEKDKMKKIDKNESKMSKTQVIRVVLGTMHPNENNPRTIKPENMRHLVRSILEFPKMLELRPIVLSQDGTILGGNMRYKALTEIAAMDVDAMQAEISTIGSVLRKTDEEKQVLIDFWIKWHEKPYAFAKGTDLTGDEETEFVLKDNIHAGQWDYDALREFSKEDLSECCITPWAEAFNMDEDSQLEKKDEEELKRIIFIFDRGRREEVEAMLGVERPGKTSYHFTELNRKRYDV